MSTEATDVAQRHRATGRDVLDGELLPLHVVGSSTLPLLGVCLGEREQISGWDLSLSTARGRKRVYAVRELFEASSPKQRADTCL